MSKVFIKKIAYKNEKYSSDIYEGHSTQNTTDVTKESLFKVLFLSVSF